LSITFDLINLEESGGGEPVRVARIIMDNPFSESRIRVLSTGFEVESRKEPGTWHTVDPETGECDCKGFGFRGHCRHRRLLERRGLLRISQPQNTLRDVLEYEHGTDGDESQMLHMRGEKTS